MAGIRSLAEFESAVKALKPIDYTHIKLYRGQGEARDLLPTLFRKLTSKVHLIHETEAKMLAHLKKRIPWNTPLRPTNDWDWLSFGQHYRLATRLLDWSAEPHVALFFAVEKTATSPTVYIYHAQKSQIVDATTKKESPVNIVLTRIMTPSVHSVRVALQKGWHSVHRLHPRKGGGNMVIPLADMEWHRGRMRTIKIDPIYAQDIRKELAKMGVHHATVYGDFEKVCASICHECGV